MPSFRLTPTNYKAIQQAIRNIAVTSAGIAFLGDKVGEVPTVDDLKAPNVGFPYFAVRQGKQVGYATGTDLNGPGDAGARGIGQSEPVWDFDCYALYDYSDSDPKYDQTVDTLIALHTTFFNNFTLNNTCAASNPHTLNIPYVQIGDQPLIAAKLTVRAYEILPVDYS